MKKLKSRKFWIAIALMGYGAIMGIRGLNIDDSKIVTVVSIIAAIAVGIGYIFAETLVDAEDVASKAIIYDEDELITEEEAG